MVFDYLEVPSCRGAVILVTLLVAIVRERLAVSKQKTQKFDVERFKLRKISELEFKKQC
jgi:hypothetical protein